jgi:Protein of unknown function (DUF669)
MKLNLKNVKGSTFDPIPEGRYNVVVDKAELTTAKDSGNAMIKTTLKITDGDFKGRLVWDNFVLIDNSLWKLKGFLEAIKSNIAESTSATEQDAATAMVGAHVSVYLEPRVGENGNVSSNVKNYAAIEQLAPATKAKSSLLD